MGAGTMPTAHAKLISKAINKMLLNGAGAPSEN